MRRFIRLTCSLTLLLPLTALTALAAPSLSQEQGVDAPVMAPFPTSNSTRIYGASDGTSVLWVWADRRSSVEVLYAARMNAQGVPLDQPPLALGTQSGSTDLPAVAFDGTNYVAVWSDVTTRRILMRRISPQGALVDATERTLAQVTTGDIRRPAIASNRAGTSLVSWVRNSSVVEAVRVNGTGQVLDAAPLGLGLNATALVQPSIGFDGTNFTVVWKDVPANVAQVALRRVSLSGTVTPATPVTVFSPASNSAPGVGCSPGQCLVVWEGKSGGNTLLGVRFSAAGVALDTPPLVLVPPASKVIQTNPRVAYDGTQYGVGYGHSNPDNFTYVPLGFVRVSTAGAVSAPTEEFHPAGRLTDLVAGPSGFWMSATNGQRAFRLSPSGVLADPAGWTIPVTANDQTSPAAAIAQNTVGLAWVDRRTGTPQVMFRRFSPEGVALDAQAKALTTATDFADKRVFGVVHDGAQFVVGWTHGMQVRAGRVSLSGNPQDPDGVLLAPGRTGDPSLVSDGTRSWVFFSRGTNAINVSDFVAVRFSQTGTVLDATALNIATGVSGQDNASSCFDGQQVWAAWDGNAGRRASRLTASGTLVTPGGAAVTGTTSFELGPRLHSGPGCAALFLDANSAVRFNRLTTAGAVLDGNGVLLPGGQDSHARAVASFDGTQWVSAWMNSTAPLSLRVSRFDTSGATPDATPVLGAPVDHLAQVLAAASDGAGTTWVLQQRFDNRPGFQSRRVLWSRVVNTPSVPTCQTDAQCSSGFCVDGFCCNTACGRGAPDCQACSLAAGAAQNGTCGPTSGNSCSDANPCTRMDVCEAGSCRGANPVTCAPVGECRAAGQCRVSDGTCEVGVPVADGTSCSLGACRAGTCVALPVSDAGVDAGPQPPADAGVPGEDGGSVTPDAGEPTEDAGSSLDGGTEVPPAPQGCGCGAGGDVGGMVFAGLALLAWLARFGGVSQGGRLGRSRLT